MFVVGLVLSFTCVNLNRQSRKRNFSMAKRYMLTLNSEAAKLVAHLHCEVKVLDISVSMKCREVCDFKI